MGTLPAGIERREAGEADLGALRVLVAEDNPVNQKVICSMLRRQGWSATVAADGEDACRQFFESQFDLVLMDVQMPVMDGLQATRRIRQEESLRGLHRTPIIVLTAHASRPQHQQCLAEGMDAVITKPVTMHVLMRDIDAVLSCGVASPVT